MDMKFDYFMAFLEETDRIIDMLNGGELEDIRMKSKFWRRELVFKVYDDFLPPFDRRDMLGIVQNLSYVSYEIYNFINLNGIQKISPYKPEIINAVSAVQGEIAKLKSKKCNILRLKGKAEKLLSVWVNAYKLGVKKEICDSLEAIADSFVKLCDAIETAVVVNS